MPMQWLGYLLLTYAAVCYLGGLYLALRLLARTRPSRALWRRLGRAVTTDAKARPVPIASTSTGEVADEPLSVAADRTAGRRAA